MGRNKELGTGLSDAVKKEIDSTPHVKTCLADGIVNYSALARKLAPLLNEKTGRILNDESIIVAIKRYADEIAEPPNSPNMNEMLIESELVLQDHMSYVHFKKSHELLKKINEEISEENWRLGEMRIMIEGAENIMIIMKEAKAKELRESFPEDIIFSTNSHALLSLRMPLESISTYGIIAAITGVLAKKGISIELVSSPPDLHFLIHEKDAERAYTTLKEIMNRAKEVTENTQKED